MDTPADSLAVLKEWPLFLIKLNEDEWRHLRGLRFNSQFSMAIPHDTARSCKKNALALIEVEDEQLAVGVITSKQTITSLDIRVKLELVAPLSSGPLGQLLESAHSANKRLPVDRLKEGGRLSRISEKVGEAILDLVASNSDDHAHLSRIRERLTAPQRFSGPRALQADAISLALKAFGRVPSDSFLEDYRDSTLRGARALEDAVIEHDARWIPKWNLESSDVTGRAVFTHGDHQLEIITANKRPLEELIGVDLIYFNAKRHSLVMVQYKMMEPKADAQPADAEGATPDDDDFEPDIELHEPTLPTETEWRVRVDDQFQDEIQRMRMFDKDLSTDGPYRLNPGPFFLKLVKRDSALNSAALYLSLGHFESLLANDALRGPKGGLRISYQALDGHYLRSDGFIELVRSGYIGSRSATTDNLQVLMEATLRNGKALVAAIESQCKGTD